MHRKTAQRGIAALALVTILALAGAQPAAAADLGFLDRLASFFSAVSGNESPGIWETLTGWLHLGEKSHQQPTDPWERGTTIDPLGIEGSASTSDPVAGPPE